jgi:hypothetical protein
MSIIIISKKEKIMLKIRVLSQIIILLCVISIFCDYGRNDIILSNQEERMQQYIKTDNDQTVNEIISSFTLGFGDEQEPEIVETMLPPSFSEVETLVFDTESYLI